MKNQGFKGSPSSKNDQENYKKTLKNQPRKGNEKNMKIHQQIDPKSNQKALKIHSKINVFSRTLQKTIVFAPRTAPGHLKVAVLIFWGRFWRPLGF